MRTAGFAALQSGRAAAARQCFEEALRLGDVDAALCCGLAMACRELGDWPAVNQAAERALRIDQANLPAMILKGDCLQAGGNVRSATSFYGVAIALAERAPDLPPSLAAMVQHARAARDRINDDIARHLRERMTACGYDRDRSSARFSHAFELLTGGKSRYVQQPRAFFYPDLPDTQFHPRAQFPWLEAVESATDDICDELAVVLQQEGAFAPYVRDAVDAPANRSHRLLNSADWSAHFLCKDGALVPENAGRCPKTLAALAQIPLARIPGRTPSILFSRLRAGARIPPHTGFLNCRLICHLPLLVPPGCWLRVGNDEREWRRGHAWVFNDTIEHEARNDSGESRVILIFDVWHPALDDDERALVSALMQAVDSYGAAPRVSWNE